MKYYNYQVTTSEIPDEITLCINLTNCPIHCADCHSKFLWEDVGVELTKEELYRILNENSGISCICFMGGDADYEGLARLFSSVFEWVTAKTSTNGHPVNSTRPPTRELKVALYSGRSTVQDLLDRAGVWIKTIDYIKVGPYIKELGPIDKKSTNQRLYKISSFSSWNLATKKVGDSLERVCGFDITHKFWNKEVITI